MKKMKMVGNIITKKKKKKWEKKKKLNINKNPDRIKFRFQFRLQHQHHLFNRLKNRQTIIKVTIFINCHFEGVILLVLQMGLLKN